MSKNKTNNFWGSAICFLFCLTLLTSGCVGPGTLIAGSSISTISQGIKYYKSASVKKTFRISQDQALNIIGDLLDELSIKVAKAYRLENGALLECEPFGEKKLKTCITVVPIIPRLVKVKIETRQGKIRPDESVSRALLEQVTSRIEQEERRSISISPYLDNASLNPR